MNAANLHHDTRTNKWVATFKGQVIGKATKASDLQERIEKGELRRAVQLGVTSIMIEGVVQNNHPVVKKERFNINERFNFVEDLMNMVITGTQPSVIITGEGGLGKTFTVMKCLKEAGLENVRDSIGELVEGEADEEIFRLTGDYIVVKGYTTPKGLFRTLYENRNRIVVFDDCDSLWKNDTSTNLLKAALDSYDQRWLTWNSEGWGESDLPKCFLFTGQVVFISNLAQHDLDQAVRSRSMCVDLAMTIDQKIDRMEHLVTLDSFIPEHTVEHKLDALAFIDQFKHQAKEISLRTLISITKIRASKEVGWEGLAEYVLCNN